MISPHISLNLESIFMQKDIDELDSRAVIWF